MMVCDCMRDCGLWCEVASREMPVSGGELAPGAAKRGAISPHLINSPHHTSHHLTSPHLTSHPPHLHLTSHTTYNDTPSPHLTSHHLTTPHITTHPPHLHLTSHRTYHDLQAPHITSHHLTII